MIHWHRLFGLALSDLFDGSPWQVELEKDLSLKQQFLDVVILRRVEGEFVGQLPDGLDALTDHNLLTYKSLHEPLDDWALKELTGHFVNYRKQLSDQSGKLLPESRFQLFAVCTRFPRKLDDDLKLRRIARGVFEAVRGTDRIRVIVLNEIPQHDHNSLWHLFSAAPEAVKFGAAHHRMRTPDASTILGRLFEQYGIEGLTMPYTIEDFRRDFTLEHLNLLTHDELLRAVPEEKRLAGLPSKRLLERLTTEERLEGLSPEKRLEGLSPEKRLEGLSPEKRLEGLPPRKLLEQLSTDERLEGLPPEKRLEGLSPEELARLVREAKKKLNEENSGAESTASG